MRRWVYFDQHLNGRTYQLPQLFGRNRDNTAISFLGIASSNPLAVFASDKLFDLGQLKNGNGGTQGVSRYRYTAAGERVDNITDWALKKFREAYGADRSKAGAIPSPLEGEGGSPQGGEPGEGDIAKAPSSALRAPSPSRGEGTGGAGDRLISPRVGEMPGRAEGGAKERDISNAAVAGMDGDGGGTAPPSVAPLDKLGADISPTRGEISQSRKVAAITRDDIFHYVYGVLHDPIYREKYALNLKREFPRIPFYPDFWKWAGWGERLMELHIGYESVEPWPLERLDMPDEKARNAGVPPKAMLKADRDNGTIRLDSETQLSGIPKEAWDYRLGNRSGLDWILDQYKEKTPKDPTIREKFNTYRFADYKEKVIDLLMRVTRVSVETAAITEAMKAARR